MTNEHLEILAWFGIGVLVTIGLLAIASALKLNRLTTEQATRFVNVGLRHIKRFIILVVGVTVILAGIVMLIGPGPGLVVIPIGLAVLATEFLWARRLLKQYKNYAVNLKQQADNNEVSRPRPLLAAFVILATIAAVLALIFLRELPWKPVMAVAGPIFGAEVFWCVLMFQRWRRLRTPASARPTPLLPPSHQPPAERC
ncbi:MAG TPA: PGPGW domain-containing protein [Phycisphaerales bacterium]|nr:PGPGW domain-containing protein [Phycisphaerales bacterium]